MQIGVKSLGCEKSTVHLSPIQSWNRIVPSLEVARGAHHVQLSQCPGGPERVTGSVIESRRGLEPLAGDPKERTPADNQTVRNVFVIGPDKTIKLVLVYPMTTGRNFDEVLRVIDSLQLTAKHKVATPVNWQPGEDVIIAGSVSDDEARKTYPQGWKAPKPYIRIVPQPR